MDAIWLLRFFLNLRDNFLAHKNILATNQFARRTIEPFENNNKRSQDRLCEGGSLSDYDKITYLLNLGYDSNCKLVGKYIHLIFQKRKEIINTDIIK